MQCFLIMSNHILFALWFFLPAGIANVTPILVSHVPGLSRLNVPLDNGWRFHGHRLFGAHKTWRGVLSGAFVGTLTVWLQVIGYRHSAWIRSVSQPVIYDHISIFALGLLLSLGALIGDTIESAVKRQVGVSDGQRWFPFDQVDYVVGGLIAVSFYIRLSLEEYGLILVIWFAMHLIFSYLGFLLKLKRQPI